VPGPANSSPAELLEALDAVRGRIAGLRWSLEEGTRDTPRLLAELREAERELDELHASLRAAERRLAAPPPQPRPERGGNRVR
jgi:hypothetical protein